MLPRRLSSAIRIGLRLLKPIHRLALRASVSGLTFSPLVLYGALSSSHQLLALRKSPFHPLYKKGKQGIFLALRASVSALTFSRLVLYGALSSSHQHRSIQIPSYKEKSGG